MAPISTSSLSTIDTQLLALAIEYHKVVEGEYGCNGATCPGVQRLFLLLQRGVAKVEHPNEVLGEPDFWRCKTCGCLWRDNHDGSMSLGSQKQISCRECEMKPAADVCEPLFRSLK